MISKILQILGLQPWISIFFSRSLKQFFLTVGQNNFGNKIPKLPEIQILNWLYMQSQLTMGMGPYSVHVLHIYWYPTSCISNLLHYYRPVGTKQSSFMGSYFKRVQLANCKNLKHDRIVIFLFADTFIFILPKKYRKRKY